MRTSLVVLVLVLGFASGAWAQSTVPRDDDLNVDTCASNPAACGLPVVVGDGLVGPSNGTADCRTRRIVDTNDMQRGTDFIPVCDDGEGNARPDSTDADGNPVCTPFPSGRVPPAWTQTELPVGALEMNPDPEGLTGLQSWFWYTGPTQHQWLSPVFEGRTADCRILPAPTPLIHTAALTTWRYDIGDSRSAAYTADSSGDEPDPAARHTYRTKGDWEATVACTWTGPPPTALTMPCAQRTVPVIEVRGVITE